MLSERPNPMWNFAVDIHFTGKMSFDQFNSHYVLNQVVKVSEAWPEFIIVTFNNRKYSTLYWADETTLTE